MRRFRNIPNVILMVVLALAVGLAACDSDTSIELRPEDGTAAPESPEATTPPETAPPETPDVGGNGDAAQPADGEDGDGIPPWVWIVGLLALVGLVSWLGARSGSNRSEPADAAQPPPTPDDPAAAAVRQALGDAQWLHDKFDTIAVVSHADATYAFTTNPDSPAPRSTDWDAIPSRLADARSSLATASGVTRDPAIANACTQLMSHMDSTSTAISGLHDARVARRAADDGLPNAIPQQEARAADQRAQDDLSVSRSALQVGIATASSALGI